MKQESSSSVKIFFGLRRRKYFTEPLIQEIVGNETELLKPKLIVSKTDYYTPLILTFISIFTRLFKIGRSDYVVWDEAHFGIF